MAVLLKFLLCDRIRIVKESLQGRGGTTGRLGGTCPPRRGILGIFVRDRVTDHDKKLTLFQSLYPDAMSYEIINMR